MSLPCATEAGPGGLARRMAGRLAMIVGLLKHVVAARAGRDRAVVPVVLLLWNRLARLTRLFDALAARVAAGIRAPAPRIRAARASATAPTGGGERLPRGRGWLTRLMVETNGARSQLEHLLRDPEMAALLAAEPAAARLLRPLCRMLMVDMPPVADAAPATPMRALPRPERPVEARRPVLSEGGGMKATDGVRPSWPGD